MAIFDNLEQLGKTLTEKSKGAARKAKDITEIMSLKAQISTEKNVINDLYARIGKKYFDEQKYDHSDEYTEYFDKLQNGLEKISQLEQEINYIDGVRKCQSCGAKVLSEASFCSSCGGKLDRAEEPAADSEVIELETVYEDEQDNQNSETVVITEGSAESEDGPVTASITVEEVISEQSKE